MCYVVTKLLYCCDICWCCCDAVVICLYDLWWLFNDVRVKCIHGVRELCWSYYADRCIMMFRCWQWRCDVILWRICCDNKRVWCTRVVMRVWIKLHECGCKNDVYDDDMMVCCIFAFMAYYDEGDSVHLTMMGLRSVSFGGFNPIVRIVVFDVCDGSLVEGLWPSVHYYDEMVPHAFLWRCISWYVALHMHVCSCDRCMWV